jgi:uncharacterized protein YgbK (DUF1537 family)
VALKTRSIDATAAVDQSLAALAWLRAAGCRQFFFKYCSTFDSTPAGNIGPVAEALLDALGASVAVVCPAFPANGRRLFMGHLFVNDRLLSQSGMESHPLNPMTDPDIRRWLQQQIKGAVGHVPLDAVHQGTGAIRAALDAHGTDGRRLVVVDAIDDADLIAIGAAAAGDVLVTGGSGVALGLPANFRDRSLLRHEAGEQAGVDGPGCVFSGSCSPKAREQVAAYSRNNQVLQIDPGELIAGTMGEADAISWLADRKGRTPMVSTTSDPVVVAALQDRFGRERLAARVEAFFAAVAQGAVEHGYRRLVVGGGETSGAVVTALRLEALAIGREIDPGVPAVYSEGKPRIGLALKSGNFGAADFYEKALRFLGGV